MNPSINLKKDIGEIIRLYDTLSESLDKYLRSHLFAKSYSELTDEEKVKHIETISYIRGHMQKMMDHLRSMGFASAL